MMLVVSSCVSASVTIVSQNGEVLPIEKIGKPNQANNTSYSKSGTQNAVDAKSALLQKYGSIDEALVNYDQLNRIEVSALRELALEEMKRQHEQVAKEKNKAKVEAIERDLSYNNEAYQAANNPEIILKRRQINDVINKAKKIELHKPTVNMTSEMFEPELNGLIAVNTITNRPTALSFFDQMGNPYPIVKFIPQETADFKFETINDNIIIVRAENNYAALSGFVFLKNINQPIPIQYTALPEKKVDVKKSIYVPQTSPTADTSVESAHLSFSSVTKEDDGSMFSFLNGRTVAGSKLITIEGLPARSRSWKHNGYIYIKTTANMKYDVLDAKSSGNWKIYKAYPRESYWFSINQRDTEVFVHE